MNNQNDLQTQFRGYHQITNLLNYTDSLGASNPDVYIYSGNAYSFQEKSKELMGGQIYKYRSLRLNISGKLIKGEDTCCFWTTIVLGSILICLLFCLCCDWWKKRVYRHYEVQRECYYALKDLVQNSEARELYLTVQDNLFTPEKAKILEETLRISGIKNFVFFNSTQGFDIDGNNFSDFVIYMKPVQASVDHSDISWSVKVVV